MAAQAYQESTLTICHWGDFAFDPYGPFDEARAIIDTTAFAYSHQLV